MTSALAYLNAPQGSHPLVADMESVGIQLLAPPLKCGNLVQEAILHAPDVVICYDPLPSDELFKSLQALADTAPRPVLLFTIDGDTEMLDLALACGVHAFVVNGYGRHRLRPLVHLAQARFAREKALRDQLADLGSRLEERKIVERAKGVLMRARQVSDDDAFQMLRTASMHTNQRMGQVSQHIVHSARFADCVNRAGQLRMLSQRLAKLYLLQLAGMSAADATERQSQSLQRIDSNIAFLAKDLSQPTFGDLLTQVSDSWRALKAGLQAPQQASQMLQIDTLAEQLLAHAERLTDVLENAGAVAPLHVLNVAGRQRMLSQRYAKFAVLGLLGDRATQQRAQAGMAETRAAFEQSMDYLRDIPLSSPDIRAGLAVAAGHWSQMLAGSAPLKPGAGLLALAANSEGLLEAFEKLNALYEHSMQMLVG
ncbi:type IV pili methyl-accepting chemotaxis transducer N-terminal domain-containing protein [Rhodoferax sp.]|uniref:type IV pili methyl-accepting chemotaxis transducer N-terminal domain-containing protein n=1 Tax=Rhodoferax sp. TaxID=50421 RepID=UPI00374D5BAF